MFVFENEGKRRIFLCVWGAKDRA